MNTISKRLAWKETSLLRPICIACLVLLALILLAGSATINSSKEFTEFVGSLVLAMGCITGLACGILIFVFERESGTDRLLEIFPVEGRQISKAKLIQTAKYFLLYSISSIVIGWIALAIYDGGSPRLEDMSRPHVWLGMRILIPLQCLLWSIACSLVFRSSLHATITSAVLTVVTVIVLGVAITGWTSKLSDNSELSALASAHVAVCLILGGIVWWLSPAWLRGRRRTTRPMSQPAANDDTAPAPPTLAAMESTEASAYPYRSLFWQNLRQCRYSWLMAAFGLLVASYVFGIQIEYAIGYRDYPVVATMAPYLFVIAGAWIGMMMFSSDQSKSNFLFFQQRADYPRKVWFSRLMIVLAFLPIVVVAALMSAPSMPAWWSAMNPSYQQPDELTRLIVTAPVVLNSVLVFLAAAGLAQLITMLLRMDSGFIAFIVIAASCVVLAVWDSEVMISRGSVLLFIGPLVIACFATTWWFAPRWISGRGRWLGTLTSAGVLAIVTSATFFGWIWHRVNEFQAPRQSEQWTAFMKPDSLENEAEKYAAATKMKAAFKQLKDCDEEFAKSFPRLLPAKQYEKYYSSNAEVLAEISKHLRDPDCGLFLNPRSATERLAQQRRLLQALEAATRHHLNVGDASRAFDSLEDELRAAWWVAVNSQDCEFVLARMWQWASVNGNTEPMIREAIERIDQIEDMIFDSHSEVLYRESVFKIERELGSQDWQGSRDTPSYSWNMERSRRWNLRQIETSPQWQRLCFVQNDTETVNTNQYYFKEDSEAPDLRTISINTPLDVASAPYFARLRNLFRYTKVRLALSGWKLKNGNWPKHLDELCEPEQPWLDEMPLSLFSGRQFAYSDTGLDDRVFFNPEPIIAPLMASYRWAWQTEFEADVAMSQNWINRDKPFLLPWSGVVGEKHPFVREVYDEEAGTSRPVSKTELGHWIPIGHAHSHSLLQNVEDYELE